MFSAISETVSRWLSELNENREQSKNISDEYRRQGNENYVDGANQNDLAADYYTKAIFSAPKPSIELAFAHANRAACSLSSNTFPEVTSITTHIFE